VFEVREVDLAGRIGRLYTPHGYVETPAFFPVIDVYRQEIPLSDVESLGFSQIITNAYLLYKRFGDEIREKGVHSFLGWNRVIMTDSGAYQILQYGTVDVSQEEILMFQIDIGSDISVILDIPTGDTDRPTAERSVEETIRRAREALAIVEGSKNLWVLPVQGGKYLDLVEKSAREASKIPGYSIYAVGSPTVFLEKYDYYTVLKTRDRRVITGGKGSSSAGSKSYSSRSGRSYSSGNRSGSRSIRITPKSYSPRHYSGGSRRTIRRR
jgi:7-cyano-7-deazaguanine tRNA-ribosyltransferase